MNDDATKTTMMYCVKCRHKVSVSNPKPVKMKSGRNAEKGFCPHCGTGCYVIVAKD